MNTSGVFALTGEEIAGFTDVEAIEAMAAARTAVCRAEAVQARAVARLNQVRGGVRSVADEIAPELGVSRQAAQGLVGLADALLSRLPSMLAAMDAGDADLSKAGKVHEVTAPLSDALCRQVDADLAGKVGGKDPTQIRRAARDAVHKIDGRGAGERATKRREDRKVQLVHEEDAMATLLLAYLPAETASAVYCRVDAIARTLKTKTETRTLDQLRVDVLADILLGTLTGHGGVAAHVFLHVPLDTALKITDHGCELAGHGPIPGEIARQIMNDPNSVWRKVTTDPMSGAVLDVGRKRRRPPAALDDFVKVRDRECLAPGCHRPAQRCDVDHAKPWAKLGRTAKDVLDCFCEHHHYLKDVPGWDFHYNGDTGELTITTPAGRVHQARPDTIIPPRPTVEINDDDTEPPF